MPSLDCPLLGAAACTYGITAESTLAAQQPWYEQAGFLEPPSVVACGISDIDAALVGRSARGILVAFRGTLPPDRLTQPVLLDWLQSFAFEPAVSPLFPGAVHSGFLDAFRRLWPEVQAAVDSLRGRYADSPLFVTGHSKGGAVATLAAARFSALGINPSAVVTFASPRPGDSAFVRAYGALGIPQRRYENHLDAVPFYPPDFDSLSPLRALPGWSARAQAAANWDYQPVGELRYIQQDGSVVGDSPGLHHARIMEIFAALVDGHAARVADAHSLVPPTTAGQTPAASATTPPTYARGVCAGAAGGDEGSPVQQAAGR